MKKRILTTVIALVSILFFWFDQLFVDAKMIDDQLNYRAIDPQKAVIATVIAIIAGVICYLWRHREQFRK